MANLGSATPAKRTTADPCPTGNCGDTNKNKNGVIERRAITVKVKTTLLIPVNGVDGAFEAAIQKAVTDAASVGGALIQNVTSKTKTA